MNPIITGDEILVPLNYGDLVTNRRANPLLLCRPAPQPVQMQPVQMQPVQMQPVQMQHVQMQPVQMQPVQVAKINLWEVIDRLNWVDRDDNVEPTINPKCPSKKWTFAEWHAVQLTARPYYNQLTGYLDKEDFWHKNGIADQDRAKFVWHVIARGQQIYDAVLHDVSFGCGYIGQDCGFTEFISHWS